MAIARGWQVLLAGACAFALCFGCANVKKRPEGGSAEPQAPPAVGAPSAIFPHQSGWAAASSHGDYVVRTGYDNSGCIACHSVESAASGAPPACASCHPLYPHPEGWAGEDKHGAWVRANGKSPCATQCHGPDLKGGLSGIACDRCHTIYPHQPGWNEAKAHGEVAEFGGKAICRGCHGDDYRGGTSGKSCFRCHVLYPHMPGWAEAVVHGVAVDKLGGTGKCQTLCHGADLKGGLSGIGCDNGGCHGVYPHPAGWRDPKSHGAPALIGGATLCGTQCHGADFSGGLSGVSCKSGACHPLYPHPDGWVESHRAEVIRVGEVFCQGCHGADFKRLLDGRSCFTCHENYPHGDTWRQPSEHGVEAFGDGKTACATASCHGLNYEGRGTAPSCSDARCHQGYPHLDPQWTANGKDSAHAKTFIELVKADAAACTKCHGANYDRPTGEEGKGRCTACHERGVTHRPKIVAGKQVPWKMGAGHGEFFSLTLGLNSYAKDAYCWNCHGAPVVFNDDQKTVDALKSASTCYNSECHWSYPHIFYQSQSQGGAIWLKREEPKFAGGHMYYLMFSPLLVDASGKTVASGADSMAAVKHTCGRAVKDSEPLCHYNGRHYDGKQTVKRGKGMIHCDYCHL